MTEQEIKDLVTRQRSYFQSGATLPVSARLAALRRLYDGSTRHFEKTWEKADLRAICVRQAWYWKRSAIC